LDTCNKIRKKSTQDQVICSVFLSAFVVKFSKYDPVPGPRLCYNKKPRLCHNKRPRFCYNRKLRLCHNKTPRFCYNKKPRLCYNKRPELCTNKSLILIALQIERRKGRKNGTKKTQILFILMIAFNFITIIRILYILFKLKLTIFLF
jgi:Cornifin (SPRR) family